MCDTKEKEQKMRVQQINSNQPAFGIRSIRLDRSLAEHASPKILKAIVGAMTDELYNLHDNITDIFIYAQKKSIKAGGNNPSDNYYLGIRFLKELSNGNISGGSVFDKPDSTIKNSTDIVEAIISNLEGFNQSEIRTSAQILAETRAKAAAFNPKD